MAGDETADEPDESARPSRRRTWDPNEGAIWPVYPAGTRLPIPEMSRRKQAVMFVFVLALLGGAAFLIYWFVDTVGHH